ncbi:RNA-binding protein [Phyllobacterium sp. P30BS-XVII]|uniref:RNA-binding protein n=1 Tax=Phyllobacterium sp. P30BS-XVII TaxID=2587046 RepID=UPI000DD97432|nr:RNA-binding protein [Phyllobacterium sp. P30BS-XVII]
MKCRTKRSLADSEKTLYVEPEMNDRTCIVTREGGSVDDMIRFVASPDGTVVADLKRNLPGRGCWVKAERRYIDEAVKRKLFPRALKTNVTVPDNFGLVVEQMLVKFALGSFGLARKAGVVVTGAAKVDSAIRSGTAALVLHAREAAEDGVRKLDQARRSVVYAGGPEIPALSLFESDEMDLALGGVNVIHAAVLKGKAAAGFIDRARLLQHFRDGRTDLADAKAAPAAKETETE